MTEQAIKIAIAIACGWKLIGYGQQCDVVMEDPSGKRLFGSAFIPNYCHDLNAMHEAQKTLDGPQLALMHSELLGVMNRTEHLQDWCVFRCDARQRAEAFLRCKGLWKA